MSGSLIDDEQKVFRLGRGCVDHIFSLEQLGERALEKGQRVYVRFVNLDNLHLRVNREVVWQEPRIFDVDFKLISCSRNMYVIVYPV